MSRTQTPSTPRFDDRLEQVLRTSVKSRARRNRWVRRRGLVAMAATAVVLALTLAVLPSLRDGSGGRVETSGDEPGSDPDVRRGPSETATTSPPPQSTAAPDTTTSAPPTTAPPETAVVNGLAGGPPPCAPVYGDYAASVTHPERAPLIAEATFAGGVRWAICGADSVFSSEILNLRSDDSGATWLVSDTGIGLLRFHAGDAVEVNFVDATSAEMRIVSQVGERDERYETTDGGRTWRCVATLDPDGPRGFGSLCGGTPNESG